MNNQLLYLLLGEEHEDAVDMKSQTGAIRTLRTYQIFHISLNGVKSAQPTVALLLIGGLAVGLTMLICMTLLCYDKVPINVYIAAPISAVIVILIVNITVPQVIVVRDMSKLLIRKWKGKS